MTDPALLDRANDIIERLFALDEAVANPRALSSLSRLTHPVRASCDSADLATYFKRCLGHNVSHVSPPSFECFLALREKLVPLIHGCNP